MGTIKGYGGGEGLCKIGEKANSSEGVRELQPTLSNTGKVRKLIQKKKKDHKYTYWRSQKTNSFEKTKSALMREVRKLIQKRKKRDQI